MMTPRSWRVQWKTIEFRGVAPWEPRARVGGVIIRIIFRSTCLCKGCVVKRVLLVRFHPSLFFSEEGDMDSSKQHANGNGKESIDYCLST